MQNSVRVDLTVDFILHSLVPVDQGWVDGLYINQSIPVPRFRLFICRSEGEGAGPLRPAPSRFPSREPGGRRLYQEMISILVDESGFVAKLNDSVSMGSAFW